MKNYLCKDCKNNNHGWCTVNKRNKLKEVTVCDNRNTDEDPFESVQKTNESFKFNNSNSHRVVGKREMLHTIQRQILAMENDFAGPVLNEIKKVLVTLSDVTSIEESIHGVVYDYEIDQDINKASKKIANYWRNI